MTSSSPSSKEIRMPFFERFYRKNTGLINVCSYLFAVTGILLQINSPFPELRMLSVTMLLITTLLFIFIVIKFLLKIVFSINEKSVVANQFFGILTLLLIIFVFKNLLVFAYGMYPQEFIELIKTSSIIVIVGCAALHQDLKKYLVKNQYRGHNAVFIQHLYLFILFFLMCVILKPDFFFNAKNLPEILGVIIGTMIASITITTLFSSIFYIKDKLIEIPRIKKLVKEIDEL